MLRKSIILCIIILSMGKDFNFASVSFGQNLTNSQILNFAEIVLYGEDMTQDPHISQCPQKDKNLCGRSHSLFKVHCILKNHGFIDFNALSDEGNILIMKNPNSSNTHFTYGSTVSMMIISVKFQKNNFYWNEMEGKSMGYFDVKDELTLRGLLKNTCEYMEWMPFNGESCPSEDYMSGISCKYMELKGPIMLRSMRVLNTESGSGSFCCQSIESLNYESYLDETRPISYQKVQRVPTVEWFSPESKPNAVYSILIYNRSISLQDASLSNLNYLIVNVPIVDNVLNQIAEGVSIIVEYDLGPKNSFADKNFLLEIYEQKNHIYVNGSNFPLNSYTNSSLPMKNALAFDVKMDLLTASEFYFSKENTYDHYDLCQMVAYDTGLSVKHEGEKIMICPVRGLTSSGTIFSHSLGNVFSLILIAKMLIYH